MPLPYSDNLRSKFLQAYVAGDLCRLASQFGVSWGWAKMIRRQQLSFEQSTHVSEQRHGFPSRINAEQRELLCAWLPARN
jgi:transposase